MRSSITSGLNATELSRLATRARASSLKTSINLLLEETDEVIARLTVQDQLAQRQLERSKGAWIAKNVDPLLTAANEARAFGPALKAELVTAHSQMAAEWFVGNSSHTAFTYSSENLAIFVKEVLDNILTSHGVASSLRPDISGLENFIGHKVAASSGGVGLMPGAVITGAAIGGPVGAVLGGVVGAFGVAIKANQSKSSDDPWASVRSSFRTYFLDDLCGAFGRYADALRWIWRPKPNASVRNTREVQITALTLARSTLLDTSGMVW